MLLTKSIQLSKLYLKTCFRNAKCTLLHQGNEPFSVWCMIFLKTSNLRWQKSVKESNAFNLSSYALEF